MKELTHNFLNCLTWLCEGAFLYSSSYNTPKYFVCGVGGTGHLPSLKPQNSLLRKDLSGTWWLSSML